jgi:hypothetical protein
MDDVVIFPGRKRLALLALGAVAFAAGGGFIVAEDTMPWFARFIGGYLGMALFAFCLVYACFRLAKPLPSLVIGREGLLENAQAVGPGMLRWSEIADVKIQSFLNWRFLAIIPRDLEAVLQRQGRVKQWLMRMKLRLVESPFNVPESALPVKLEDVLAYINTRRGADGAQGT